MVANPIVPGTRPEDVSLRISVTDRCQFRCLYCVPPDGIGTHEDPGEVLSFDEILRFVRVVKSGWPLGKIHITGGEPLVRPGVAELVAMLADEVDGDLALTTNGKRLSSQAGRLKRAGLRRVNVSLDSLNERVFAKLSGGGRLSEVLGGIEAARAEGFSPVKINTLVLRGFNDAEVVPLARFALQQGMVIRFLELMPIGCARSFFDPLFVSASEVRERLRKAFSLKRAPSAADGSSRYFEASDHAGLAGAIGFIASETEPFCEGCRRLRLSSTGVLISCLARGCGPQIGHLLRERGPEADETLRQVVASALREKRPRGAFDTGRAMVAVGG